jgi:hypothetical protein
VTATSISQVTPNFPSDFIQVSIVARLKNYQSVTQTISFRVAVDEPALNISIYFNGGTTPYYSGNYNSLPHYVATTNTFSYAATTEVLSYTINYPSVTPVLGNIVQPY